MIRLQVIGDNENTSRCALKCKYGLVDSKKPLKGAAF